MAAALNMLRLNPELILSSTATRAAQTADLFAAELGIEVIEKEELYLAGPTTLLDAAAQSGAKSLIIVAHNPGISSLAERFAPQISHMPSSAITVLQWDCDDWDVASAAAPKRVETLTPSSITR